METYAYFLSGENAASTGAPRWVPEYCGYPSDESRTVSGIVVFNRRRLASYTVTECRYIMFWAKTSPVPEAATDLGEMAPPKVVFSERRPRSDGGPVTGAGPVVAGAVVQPGPVVATAGIVAAAAGDSPSDEPEQPTAETAASSASPAATPALITTVRATVPGMIFSGGGRRATPRCRCARRAPSPSGGA